MRALRTRLPRRLRSRLTNSDTHRQVFGVVYRRPTREVLANTYVGPDTLARNAADQGLQRAVELGELAGRAARNHVEENAIREEGAPDLGEEGGRRGVMGLARYDKLRAGQAPRRACVMEI